MPSSENAILSPDAIVSFDKPVTFNVTVAAPPSADPFVTVIPPFVATANDCT